MIADSFDGRWTNSSASLGAGLALAAVGSLFSSVQDENLDYPPADYVKAAFVLPPEKKIVIENEINNPELTPERNREINLGKLFKSTLNNRLHRNLACVIDKSSRGAKLERAFEELP